MKAVVGFFGGDSQVGTTMVAQSFAESMAERGKRVLLIFGSGNYGETFMRMGQSHSIDDLKAGIRSGRVEREELMQALEKKKALWVLPGVRNALTAKHFPENTYEVLLPSVREDFDYVVIDGGSNPQMGMTISALHDCDHRFFIITQQAKSLHRYMQYQEQILNPLEISTSLIVNKYIKDPALFLKTDILKLSGKEDAFLIPYIEYGWQAEMEGRTLMPFKGFRKAVKELTAVFEPMENKEGRWKKNFV